MSTSEDVTVPVRVEDLADWSAWFQEVGMAACSAEVQHYLPKPKLVTVDLGELKTIRAMASVDIIPALWELIDRLEKEA